MAIGPTKQAYLNRVKAAQAARSAKTPSPVVEAAKQSVKQARRRRYHQPFSRNGGTGGPAPTPTKVAPTLGLGNGLTTPTTSGTGGGTGGGTGLPYKRTLEGGKGFQVDFTAKEGWAGAQLISGAPILGGGGRLGRGGAGLLGNLPGSSPLAAKTGYTRTLSDIVKTRDIYKRQRPGTTRQFTL